VPDDISVSVTGISAAKAKLGAVADSVNPQGGLRPALQLATGMVHRYLIGLGQDYPPVGQQGVLPVQTGRLKNSFFWLVESRGNDLVGRVATNLEYAEKVNRRRLFMERVVRDQAGPVNDLLGTKINLVINKGG
jgi:hypothetical protein